MGENEGSDMDLAFIRARVRQLIETGTLPCETGKTWAGRGVGDTCVACTEPISATEIEFEVDLASGETVRLHSRCHEIWTQECQPETGVAGRS